MNTVKITALGLLVSLLLLVDLIPTPARAQMCRAAYEVIVTLLPPRLGFPTVWDASYGDRKGMIQFFSGVPLQGGTVLAVGRKLSLDDYKPQDILLVELNRRGRALRTKSYPAKKGEFPLKIIQSEAGNFIVASSLKGGKSKASQWTRISWYNKDLKFQKELLLKDPVFDYEARNLIKAVEGKGVIIVIHAVNRKDPHDRHGILVRINDKKEILWKRAYRPGIPNMISSLTSDGAGGYIAVGEIEMEKNHMAGWALNLGHDGTILWQHSYPRGAAAALHYGAPYAQAGRVKKGFILLGDTTPLNDDPDAAWIMAVDHAGQTLWQRYYRRPDYAFYSKGLLTHEDGRISMALNAKTIEGGALASPDYRGHIRLLTLSPRGVTLQDESYIEGRQATGMDMVRGLNEERIVTATIDSDALPPPIEDILSEEGDDSLGEKSKESAPPPPTQKGWVFVAPALDPYEDPCL